jgi:hypothetical protein
MLFKTLQVSLKSGSAGSEVSGRSADIRVADPRGHDVIRRTGFPESRCRFPSKIMEHQPLDAAALQHRSHCDLMSLTRSPKSFRNTKASVPESSTREITVVLAPE